MKAVLIKEDKSLSWSNVPDPVIKGDEVLVKVEYAAVNRADLMQREGNYPPPEGCPEWMGLEISGTIDKDRLPLHSSKRRLPFSIPLPGTDSGTQ